MHETPSHFDPGPHPATLQDIHRPPAQIEDALAYLARILDQLEAEPGGLVLLHDTAPRPTSMAVHSSGIVVGRSLQAAYRAADDTSDPTLSALHFRVFERDSHVWVEDLGSTNGTWVGGERAHTCILRTGDILRAGKQRFIFIDSQDQPKDPPAL